MFKEKCEMVANYDLEISKDIVKFCQWLLDDEQSRTLYNDNVIVELIDIIANKGRYMEVDHDEINIEYEE